MSSGSATVPINLNTSLKILFYASQVLMITPFKWGLYWKQKLIEFSLFSGFIVVANVTVILGQSHFFAINFIRADSTTSTLTLIVGIATVYIEPLMLLIDILAILINRNRLVKCLNRLQHIDEQLTAEGIPINLWILRRQTVMLLIGMGAYSSFLTFAQFHHHRQNSLTDQGVIDYFWFLNVLLVSLTNTTSKIWFVALLFCLRQKFQLINRYLDEIHNAIFENRSRTYGVAKDPVTVSHAGYLHREIVAATRKSNAKWSSGRRGTVFARKWSGVVKVVPGKDNEHIINSQTKALDIFINRNNHITVNHDVLDSKLTDLCRIHYELCDVGQTISRMFSVQMLLLMAYGFMTITSQIYFSYCSEYGQTIPNLLRSAKTLWYSGLFIIFVIMKCVYVIMISWTTKLVSQKTGVYLHKVANAVDESDCYHMINQLSLKVLNHKLNFTACGFFDLDMATLYAITGAITTYLVILIQLNSAAQTRSQAAISDNGTALTTTTTAMPSTTTTVSSILTTLI